MARLSRSLDAKPYFSIFTYGTTAHVAFIKKHIPYKKRKSSPGRSGVVESTKGETVSVERVEKREKNRKKGKKSAYGKSFRPFDAKCPLKNENSYLQFEKIPFIMGSSGVK